MDREEMITDAVDRLDKTVKRLEVLLDGDARLGLRGVINRVTALEEQVEALRNTRVSAMQWLIGYVMFGLFVFFTPHAGSSFIGFPQEAAASIGLFMFVLAAVFFVSGLGWIRWK